MAEQPQDHQHEETHAQAASQAARADSGSSRRRSYESRHTEVLQQQLNAYLLLEWARS